MDHQNNTDKSQIGSPVHDNEVKQVKYISRNIANTNKNFENLKEFLRLEILV